MISYLDDQTCPTQMIKLPGSARTCCVREINNVDSDAYVELFPKADRDVGKEKRQEDRLGRVVIEKGLDDQR